MLLFKRPSLQSVSRICVNILLCVIILISLSIQGTMAECHFPEYIQSPLDEFGEPMPWQTKVSWLNLRNEPKMREMQEIYVVRSHIWSQRQNNRLSCDRKSRRVRNRATSPFSGNCSEKNLLYNRTCLIEERFNRFRVVQYGPSREPTFLCLKFIRRSDNVIQVMEGPIKRTNQDEDLCDERKLHVDEWPWIAPWRRQVVSCPISGGFSFRTVNKLTNQDFCNDEWRKSRLEIDCTKGDGLNFIAPKGSHCNPFSSEFEETKFFCWAGWQDKFYTFLVVGSSGGVPQYCLRFPRDLGQTFSVMVYFSVICPMPADGMPPTGIEYHELRMNKLDPNNCVDDDPEKCDLIDKRGQCRKEEKFAMHCEKTCKKCDEKTKLLETMCPFAAIVQGTWLFIDHSHKEEVRINHTTLQFSQFGTFICKERSVFSEKLYKTVTLFDNGCAMRYTCIELQRRNNNILQFRVGASFRGNTGFDTLCKFEDYRSPMIDPYRTSKPKHLILDGLLRDEYCGFSHSIPFNGTIYGEPCIGTIADWDSDGCVTRGMIRIQSDTCTNLATPLEYQCLAFLNDQPLEQFLITRSTISGNYNCWVLTSFLCSHWNWKYRALVKLDSAQCVTLADSTCALDNTPEALLYLEDDEKSRHCKGMYGHKFDSLPSSTVSLPTHYNHQENMDQPPYHIPGKEDSTYPVFQKPFFDHSNSASSSYILKANLIVQRCVLTIVGYSVTSLLCSRVFPT